MYSLVTKIAIGKFYSIHNGHLKIIDSLDSDRFLLIIDIAKDNEIFYRDEILKKYNCKYHTLKFNDIKDMNLNQFLDLIDNLFPNLKQISLGYDFRCCKDRVSDAEDVKNNFNGKVMIFPAYTIDNEAVHTKIIIDYLNSGEVEKANKFLGYNYYLKGFREIGNGLGSEKLFPTINIKVDLRIILKYGVYNCYFIIGEDRFNAVVFIGNRVSVDNIFSIEIHILNSNNFTYDNSKLVKVEFLSYIRENKKFKDLNSLKKQISDDIKSSNHYFKSLN